MSKKKILDNNFFFDRTELIRNTSRGKKKEEPDTKRPLIKPSKFFRSTEKKAPLSNKENRINQFIKEGYSCTICGLDKGCITPRMEAYGDCKKGILVVGEAPGKLEDEKGIPFIGESGDLLFGSLYDLGIDLDKDCLRTNVLQCRPPDNKFPVGVNAKCCWSRVEEQIQSCNPKLILAFGGKAVDAFLNDSGLTFNYSISSLRGKVIPFRKYNCWLAFIFHPAYILRNKNYNDVFFNDISRALTYKDKKLISVPFDKNKNNNLITDLDEAVSLIRKMKEAPVTALDYETSSIEEMYLDSFRLYTIGLCSDIKEGYCIPYDYKGVWSEKEKALLNMEFSSYLKYGGKKIIHNVKFEDAVSRKIFGVKIKNSFDTMIASHILDERKSSKSLAYQIFVRWGDIESKASVNLDNGAGGIPLEILSKYNSLDARWEMALYNEQIKEVNPLPNDFYQRAVLTLSEMENVGIKVDLDELDKMSERFEERIETEILKIPKHDLSKKFYKKYRREFNQNSSKDIQSLLYDMCKITPPKEESEAGNYSVDADSLDRIKDSLTNRDDKEISDLLGSILTIRKLGKLNKTYLLNWKELVDALSLLHPSIDLHLVDTFRSCCSNPNLQNIPARDEDGKRIRKCLVPHIGEWFLECDFSGAEVRMMANYSRDKNLIDYIISKHDFHKDWASRIFKLPLKSITSQQRYDAKNGWVFAMFYGSWYKERAKYQAFREAGVTEGHLRQLERDIKKEFPGVFGWHEEVKDFYKRKGYVETFFGFRRNEPLSNNQIINTPIQGTAFHMLLYGLMEFIDWLIENDYRSRPEIQIHDSVLIDSLEEEIEDVVDKTEEFLTKKRWDWETVPMELEWKIGKNLLEMEKL